LRAYDGKLLHTGPLHIECSGAFACAPDRKPDRRFVSRPGQMTYGKGRTMRKDTITFSQSVLTLVLFIFGSSVVFGVSSTAQQDSWLSLIFAWVMVLPLLLVYARIMHLFPETDLFDVIEILFGKIFGKVFIALFTWYAIHLCSLVLRNFTEFMQIVSLQETPQVPMMIALILVTAYLARSGINILGKWSMIMFPIVTLTVILTIVMALSDLHYENLEPFLNSGLQKIISGSFQIVTFPFAETVLFLCIAGAVSRQVSPYKTYIFAVLIGGGILLVIIFRNIMIIGPAMINASYFPSYTAARILHIGDFISRIEGSITMNFLLAGITKITFCMLAGAKGIAKLFAVEDYKRMIMPTSMLVVALCAIVYKSTMEMFGFIQYYQVYALPFEVLIPLLVWITAEVRARKNNNKRTAA
jgi:spore germination protein KB